MNRRGASALRIVLVLAAVLAAVILFAAGQLWLGIPFAIFAAILGIGAAFSRARTPSD
jgi:hypothetical protein